MSGIIDPESGTVPRELVSVLQGQSLRTSAQDINLAIQSLRAQVQHVPGAVQYKSGYFLESIPDSAFQYVFKVSLSRALIDEDVLTGASMTLEGVRITENDNAVITIGEKEAKALLDEMRQEKYHRSPESMPESGISALYLLDPSVSITFEHSFFNKRILYFAGDLNAALKDLSQDVITKVGNIQTIVNFAEMDRDHYTYGLPTNMLVRYQKEVIGRPALTPLTKGEKQHVSHIPEKISAHTLPGISLGYQASIQTTDTGIQIVNRSNGQLPLSMSSALENI